MFNCNMKFAESQICVRIYFIYIEVDIHLSERLYIHFSNADNIVKIFKYIFIKFMLIVVIFYIIFDKFIS